MKPRLLVAFLKVNECLGLANRRACVRTQRTTRGLRAFGKSVAVCYECHFKAATSFCQVAVSCKLLAWGSLGGSQVRATMGRDTLAAPPSQDNTNVDHVVATISQIEPIPCTTLSTARGLDTYNDVRLWL